MNSCGLGEELAKNEEMNGRTHELDYLREWVLTQPDLQHLEKPDLILFWHRNYYDVAATKVNIVNHVRLRMEMPEFFANRDPDDPNLQQIVQTVTVSVMPNLTAEGYVVVLLQLLNDNPNVYDFTQAVKYLNMVVDLFIYKHGTKNGYLYICNLNGVTPKHLDNLPAEGLRKFFEYMNLGVHFRWKGLHFFNSASKSGLCNDYIRRKILEIQSDRNVYLHETMASLAKIVPVELLPYEMGGYAGKIQDLHATYLRALIYYSPILKSEERSRADTARIDENTVNEFFQYMR